MFRIGTLPLARPPLAVLPSHRSDRFPRSLQEPGLRSCRLHAGCRPDSKQEPSGLVPGQRLPPVLTSSMRFRHVISGSLAFNSAIHTGQGLALPFPNRLTTMRPGHTSWFRCTPARSVRRAQRQHPPVGSALATRNARRQVAERASLRRRPEPRLHAAVRRHAGYGVRELHLDRGIGTGHLSCARLVRVFCC